MKAIDKKAIIRKDKNTIPEALKLDWIFNVCLTEIIKDAKVIDNNGKTIAENINNISYRSMYDIKKIKSLYSNLDKISFWNLEN